MHVRICVSKVRVRECKWADEIPASCEMLRDVFWCQALLSAFFKILFHCI